MPHSSDASASSSASAVSSDFSASPTAASPASGQAPGPAPYEGSTYEGSTAAAESARFADVVAQLRSAGCVFAEDEARLLLEAAGFGETGESAGSGAELARLVRRRAAGLPLEQLLGWAEFCGLRIAVGPGVFVPRRRTEFLAEQAAQLAGPGSVVVDLCCGSGAVGVAVATAVPEAVLHAADVEPAAVHWARHNAQALGGRVHQGDLYAALPGELCGRVDVLVANAPYVPTGSLGLMPPEARDHEPRVALDGGVDGLDVQRRVTSGAPGWLAPGGSLLIETGERQADRTRSAMAAAGLRPRVESCPDRRATVVVGTRR